MRNFYTDVIQLHPRYNSVVRCNDLMLLEPVTRAAVQAVIANATQAGFPVVIFETYRSKERQQILFNSGASKLQTVGVHHYGLACDIVRVVNGEPSWKVDYSFLVDLCARHGLISGYNWGEPNIHHGFVDADHVQRCSVAEQNKLFSGAWYPDDTYDPYAKS